MKCPKPLQILTWERANFFVKLRNYCQTFRSKSQLTWERHSQFVQETASRLQCTVFFQSSCTYSDQACSLKSLFFLIIFVSHTNTDFWSKRNVVLCAILPLRKKHCEFLSVEFISWMFCVVRDIVRARRRTRYVRAPTPPLVPWHLQWRVSMIEWNWNSSRI